MWSVVDMCVHVLIVCVFVRAGIEGSREHWKYCVEYTESALGFAVGSLFVKEVFHGESKDKVRVAWLAA